MYVCCTLVPEWKIGVLWRSSSDARASMVVYDTVRETESIVEIGRKWRAVFHRTVPYRSSSRISTGNEPTDGSEFLQQWYAEEQLLFGWLEFDIDASMHR